jgi:flagellar hook-associated protein 2
MATISSAGVGSGLDVKSIVSQLVAIEKQPLTALQTKATTYQAQLSLYGTVKSQVATLETASTLLAGASGWNTQKAASSNATAVGVTASTSAVATSMSVEVSQLARAQSAASLSLATTTTGVGVTGTLQLELGSWSEPTTTPVAGPAFTANGTTASIGIVSTDTLSDIKTKINAANAGVTASVLKDGTSERLVIRSNTTGADAGFRLNTPADAGLAALGFTNPDSASFVGQSPLDAKVKINGVSVKSATNTMANVTTGVSLQLSQVTTAPVEITVEPDLAVVDKNIQSFVDAYNALNTTLANATKYSATTKVGGVLQGDSTTTGLQNALRSMLGSSGAGTKPTFTHLSDVGIERQTDGSLKINATKLTSAKADMANLTNLFTASTPLNHATDGFGLKVKNFTHALLTFDGRVTNKSAALQGSIDRNLKDQDRVTERASRVETQLLRQYTALDSQMATLTSLSSYVTSQIAQWNKSTG